MTTQRFSSFGDLNDSGLLRDIPFSMREDLEMMLLSRAKIVALFMRLIVMGWSQVRGARPRTFYPDCMLVLPGTRFGSKVFEQMAVVISASLGEEVFAVFLYSDGSSELSLRDDQVIGVNQANLYEVMVRLDEVLNPETGFIGTDRRHPIENEIFRNRWELWNEATKKAGTRPLSA